VSSEEIKGGRMKDLKSDTLMKPYLNVVETSIYLGLQISTIYSYTSKKVIPFYKIRRKILFKVSELNEYIENHRVKTTAEIEQEAINNIVTGK